MVKKAVAIEAKTGYDVAEWLGCLPGPGFGSFWGDSLLSNNSEEARQLRSEIP